MTTTLSYKVPPGKIDEIVKFDERVICDLTHGTVSVCYDKESHNFLVLNLAHDISTGKQSAEEARELYANIMAEQQKGGNPAYMQKLMFAYQNNPHEKRMRSRYA